jgi:hypothetical protein
LERELRLRNYERKKDPKGVNGAKSLWEIVGDRTSFILSVAAFVISTMMLYYTTIRRIDELRAVVTDMPWLNYRADIGQFVLGGELSLLFINAGARPVSVTNIDLIVGDSVVSARGTSCSGLSYSINVDPVVIEEKKIVWRKGKVVPQDYEKWITQKDGLLFFRDDAMLKAGRAVLCARARIVTPANSFESKEIELHSSIFSKSGSSGGSMSIPMEPYLIWRHEGSIFD